MIHLENNERKLNSKLQKQDKEIEELRNDLKRGLSRIPDEENKFDSSELEEKIQGIRNLLETKVSGDQVSSLKFEMQKYTDRGNNDIKKYYDKNIDEIRHTADMLRAEFEQHSQQDF